MRSMVLLLAALVAAGCTTPAADEEPLDGTQEFAPFAPAGDAEPDASAQQTPPQATEGNGTSPPASPDPTGGPAAATPPQPRTWSLTESVVLGHTLAAGDGRKTVAPAPDSARCANATLHVAAGATGLSVLLEGEAVDAEEKGAGRVVLEIVDPAGLVARVEPADPTSGTGGARSWEMQGPTAGAWTVRLVPLGPAVQQSWDVTATVTGAAVAPPATIGFAAGCG